MKLVYFFFILFSFLLKGLINFFQFSWCKIEIFPLKLTELQQLCSRKNSDLQLNLYTQKIADYLLFLRKNVKRDYTQQEDKPSTIYREVLLVSGFLDQTLLFLCLLYYKMDEML